MYAGYLRNVRAVRDSSWESPLMTMPDHLDPRALGAIAYRKPAVTLLALRNHVVGRETFDRAFREYTRRWAFRHPTPADFFRTMENASGQDLSWFWRSFYYTTDVLDLGIETVTNRTAADGTRYATVVVRQTTSVPFPIALRLKLADGTTQDARFPVDVWSRDRVYNASVQVKANAVGARLWPDPSAPDWNAANDVWGDAPAADRPGPVTAGGLPPMTPTPAAQP